MKLSEMYDLKDYFDKNTLLSIENSYGEIRESYINDFSARAIFRNGKCASIVKNANSKYNGDYSIAVTDTNGYFNWEILNGQENCSDGCIYCSNESDIIAACEIIRNL